MFIWGDVKNGLEETVAVLGGGAAAILFGSPAQAAVPPSKSNGPSVAAQLSLPTDGNTRYFHNTATKTSFNLVCRTEKDNSVQCKLDVLSLNTLTAQSVRLSYARDDQGKIVAQSRLLNAGGWNAATDRAYHNAKDRAQKIEWSASSPAAFVADNKSRSIVQNNVGRVSRDHGAVAICSAVPLSGKTGLSVCTEFDRSSNGVTTAVLPRLNNAGSLNAALNSPAQSTRAFDGTSNDSYFFKKYDAAIPAGASSAVVLAKP
ncbi:MAG: hypothetical protein DI551_07470 [Micavibrio aeruginosavorus]|uniref:Uncharacterized protein n=1 Tax=Micavibrio aeruginosavorus TaxID=349221 RepID=A0A2W5MYG3_9BACT|nr:MAG: hypothetical protein DI551_07470 [Micavibrio aeruginosavorus]